MGYSPIIRKNLDRKDGLWEHPRLAKLDISDNATFERWVLSRHDQTLDEYASFILVEYPYIPRPCPPPLPPSQLIR